MPDDKLNYYLEIQRSNEQIKIQINRLEILHQLIKDININMSLSDILERVYSKLPQAVPCCYLGLALAQNNKLIMTAATPINDYVGQPVPVTSALWQSYSRCERLLINMDSNPEQLSPVINFDDPVGQSGLDAVVIVPLLVRNQVIGVLIVGDNQVSAYGNSELKFIEQMADQLAICIENARLYKEISKGKQEWEATFKAVTDPIFLIDKNHQVLRHNLQDDRIPVENHGEESKCFQVIWHRDTPCENCPLEEVYQLGRGAYRQIQNEGAIYDSFYYPMVGSDGETYSLILHVKDVTKKEKMEAHLMHSAKLAAIGEMAAGVAHELNSPMTVVIGTAQMMQRDMGREDPRSEWLDDIISCGLRCKKIIQNLLSYSRQGNFTFTETDINQQVAKVLRLIHYQIDCNNINIIENLDNHVPKIMANGYQLQQVLINLLLNARDSLEDTIGEKYIWISTTVEVDRGKEWVVLTVRDNGCGISPEGLTKIFNPFYTSKEATKGTGLGLSVSFGIAQSHGGTIKVESQQGVGSTFKFMLPIK